MRVSCSVETGEAALQGAGRVPSTIPAGEVCELTCNPGFMAPGESRSAALKCNGGSLEDVSAGAAEYGAFVCSGSSPLATVRAGPG